MTNFRITSNKLPKHQTMNALTGANQTSIQNLENIVLFHNLREIEGWNFGFLSKRYTVCSAHRLMT